MKKIDPRTELRTQFESKWENILLQLTGFEFSVNEFKEAFLKSWDYFRTYTGEQTVDRSDLLLYKYMAKFSAANEYPNDIKPWVFDTCTKFAEGLCDAIIADCSYGKLSDGIIEIEVYFNARSFVSIDDFEEVFTKIANEYREDVYYEDDDIL